MPDLRLPDFIIAGAARSGTTWLYELLDRHPQIWMAKPRQPEPKFFLTDELYARGIDYYARTWFADAPVGAVAGEKSTNYLENAAVAARMARHLPDVKLVFILREPVARAYSNYLWSRMNGHESEDFATALALEETREQSVSAKLRFARPHAYFSRGLYAQLLTPFFEQFPRSQILCLRFEDIVAQCDDLVTRLHRFLGVSVRTGDASPLGVINPSEKLGALSEEVRAQLAARYREPNQQLQALLGPEFKGWNGR